MSQPMTYTVPPLTRTETHTAARTDPRPGDCPPCQTQYPVPHWPTSICRSSFRHDDDGTERLRRVHCTCDGCF